MMFSWNFLPQTLLVKRDRSPHRVAFRSIRHRDLPWAGVCAALKLSREAAKKPAKYATFGNNKAADLFAVGDDMLEGEILVREGKVEAGKTRDAGAGVVSLDSLSAQWRGCKVDAETATPDRHRLVFRQINV